MDKKKLILIFAMLFLIIPFIYAESSNSTEPLIRSATSLEKLFPPYELNVEGNGVCELGEDPLFIRGDGDCAFDIKNFIKNKIYLLGWVSRYLFAIILLLILSFAWRQKESEYKSIKIFLIICLIAFLFFINIPSAIPQEIPDGLKIYTYELPETEDIKETPPLINLSSIAKYKPSISLTSILDVGSKIWPSKPHVGWFIFFIILYIIVFPLRYYILDKLGQSYDKTKRKIGGRF